MPYRSDVQRITRALNWIGGGALAAGILVVNWALWWTRGVEDFRTAVIVAALGFGLPSIVALAIAWLLDPLAEPASTPPDAVRRVLDAPQVAPSRPIDARTWPRVLRYVVAVALVVVAALVRMWLDPILFDRAPFITFFLAVAFAAWLGGFWASALSTALATFIAWHWFMRGPANLPPDLLGNVVAAGVFVATALAIGALVGAMQATAEAADRMSAETRLRNAELQKVEAELRHERDRLVDQARIRAMADSSPVLIWMADASGARTHFNRRWLEFTGRTIDQAIGLHWADAVHPEDRASCLDAWAAALDARAPLRVRYRLCRFDGVYRGVVEEATPRFAADGGFDGYIGACMDVEAQDFNAAAPALRDPRAEGRA